MARNDISRSSSVDDLDDMVYISDGEDAKDSKKPAEPGMIPAIKNLYPGEKDDLGRYTTTDKVPKDLPQPEETEETSRYALLIRNNKCYDGRKSLTISSIVIQSPLLKKVLCWVLKDYPCMAPELDRLEVVSPFRPFVHRWQRLTDALNNEKDPETKSHIQLFYDALKKDLEVTLEARDDFITHQTITFNSLWMIFEPGDIIFTIINKRPIAAKLKTASIFQGRHEDVYRLECEMIYGNGVMFGWGQTRFDILEFDGMMKIHDLSVFPLKYHQDVNKIRGELIRNGEKYERMMGFCHMQYQGVALDGRQPFYVDSRIVLDPDAYKCYNPDHDMVLKPLEPSYTSFEKRDEGGIAFNLVDKEHLLCGSSVKGYSLRNKRWLDFFVDNITEIEWNKKAWDNVVLEDELKDLIYSLTDGHRWNHRGLQSKGLNILLSGPTGIGKTFIVKSIAEALHAPLFHVTPADVDLDPKNPDLESPFTDILEMCGRWNAILLFDQARSSLDGDQFDDDEGREYSQLLDALESHSAAFFVTCNAFAEDCMDERLQSRFHITLEIPELTSTTRGQNWQKSLESQKDCSFFVDSKELASWLMNGRQIANAVTAAKTLATNGVIEMKHLDRVVPANKKSRPITFSDDDWCAPPKKEKKKKGKKVDDDEPRSSDEEARKVIYDSEDQLNRDTPKEVQDDKIDNDIWSAWGNDRKKDKKKGKKKVSVEESVIEIVPKEPVQADVTVVPAKSEDDWDTWGFAPKKDKKKKKIPVEEAVIEPAPVPEEPIAQDAARVDPEKEDFDWGTWGCSNKKDKKKKKAIVEEPLVEPVPAFEEPTPAAIETQDEDWGTWGFGTKKDKKKKKAVIEEPVAEPVPVVEEPVPTVQDDVPAVTEAQEDDWWGSFAPKTRGKKSKKKAPVEEPPVVESPPYSPSSPIVAPQTDASTTPPIQEEEQDSWGLFVSKKENKKKVQTKKWSQDFTKEELQAIDDGDETRLKELGIFKAVVEVDAGLTESQRLVGDPVEYETLVKECVVEDGDEDQEDDDANGEWGFKTWKKFDGDQSAPIEKETDRVSQEMSSPPQLPQMEVETTPAPPALDPVPVDEWDFWASSAKKGKKGKKGRNANPVMIEDPVSEPTKVDEKFYEAYDLAS